jgi:hypothetical protein
MKYDTMDYNQPWFYAGPYVPSGVLYAKKKDCNYCHWLVPGYERAYDAFAVIDQYNPPAWFKP